MNQILSKANFFKGFGFQSLLLWNFTKNFNPFLFVFQFPSSFLLFPVGSTIILEVEIAIKTGSDYSVELVDMKTDILWEDRGMKMVCAQKFEIKNPKLGQPNKIGKWEKPIPSLSERDNARWWRGGGKIHQSWEGDGVPGRVESTNLISKIQANVEVPISQIWGRSHGKRRLVWDHRGAALWWGTGGRAGVEGGWRESPRGSHGEPHRALERSYMFSLIIILSLRFWSINLIGILSFIFPCMRITL